ncbi:gamma-glutamylcyclotransferase family protein [Catellatospora chokoriensis]|uniref:gamma-glutamylcyclotransferase family protein n=1 Tax=Catellatospora chokoriensis TaxID=310353 RepID=UPI00177DB284|nr:gamma-glutamylcyclotransferase [Catellatospora chokoriensis]
MSDDLGPTRRLATYGSLAPGKPNHHQLNDLAGRWFPGHVHGRLIEQGWGSALGFPGLAVDPDGERVGVEVFESGDLPEHWPRLDEFEGPQYERVVAEVHTPHGPVEACIYVLKAAPAAT